MLENIVEVGKFQRAKNKSKPIADLWIKNNKPMELSLVIDLDINGNINDSYVTEFDEHDTYRESLYYQNGNDLKKGSGVAIHDVKVLSDSKHKDFSKTLKKAENKVKYSLDFLEISDSVLPEIMSIILDTMKNSSAATYFVMLTVDGKTPYELFREKFENEIKKSWHKDKALSNEGIFTTCHCCGKVDENYNTAIYNCYNNDKESYSNIYNDINVPVFGYSLCEGCILDLLNGRRFVNENMTTSWLGSQVMFLPQAITDKVINLYSTVIKTQNDEGNFSSEKFLKQLYKNEAYTLRKLNESDTLTDIVFFKSENSYWGVLHHIQGVLPSRFGKVGDILLKYEKITNFNGKTIFFNLRDIFNVVCLQDLPKEKMTVLSILLKGAKLDRDKFFSTAMKRYREAYFEALKDKNKSYLRTSQLTKTLKTYNVLVELGCLDCKLNIVDGGTDMKMKEFKNQEEFFELNEEFFDNFEKKAWFVLGRLYDSAIYESKQYHNKSKEDKSHLESNFLLSQSFNKETFLKISNQCKDQFRKYGKPHAHQKLFLETREYMANSENSHLSSDEAKFIFYWGTEIFFTDNLKPKADADATTTDGGNENVQCI